MDENQELRTLCVPEVLFTGKVREKLEDALGGWQIVTHVISGFNLRFYQADVPPGFAAFFKEKLDLRLDVFPEPPNTWLAAEGQSIVVEETEHPLFSDDGKRTLRRIESALGELSQCSGYEFCLHLYQYGCLAPKNAGKRQIHVILGAPPGSTEYVLRDEHPETGVSFLAHCIAQTRVKGPAPGWGHVVNAKDGKPIAQIIGRNFYLFVPTDRNSMNLLPTDEGAGLFVCALRYAWNAYVTGAPPPEEKAIENQADVEKYLSLIGTTVAADLMANTIALEEEIQELRESYQRKLNRLRFLKALSIDSIRQSHKLLGDIGPWQPVMSHPLLHRLSVVEGALHVRTKPLVYGGHLLGAYVMRFDCSPMAERWKVTIYCAGESLHPKSIPHPHVGEDGAVCFGNVGLLIDEALVEQRIPDAVLLCLQWLADGYDESVAKHKLGEWPREKISSETKEVA